MRYLGLVLLLLSQQAFTAELKPATRKAFDHYAQVAEARMQAEVAAATKEKKPFLWVDGLEASRRDSVMSQLKSGEVVTEALQEKENGQAMEAPNALIHHWIAT